MRTASSGAVAMIRPLTRTVLRNSGRSAGVGEDVPPAVEQVAGPQPRRAGPRAGAARVPPIARMPGGGEQVAGRVGDDGRHRAEQPDRGAAERRSERGGGPGRGLEPRVRDEQVLRRHERFEVRAAGRLEGDVGRGDDDRDDQQLGEAEPAERVRGGTLSSAANRVRSIATITGRLRRNSTHGPSGTATAAPTAAPPRPARHLGRPGVQHQDRDQRERVEREPGAERR